MPKTVHAVEVKHVDGDWSPSYTFEQEDEAHKNAAGLQKYLDTRNEPGTWAVRVRPHTPSEEVRYGLQVREAGGAWKTSHTYGNEQDAAKDVEGIQGHFDGRYGVGKYEVRAVPMKDEGEMA